jgi:invasion protein IalB
MSSIKRGLFVAIGLAAVVGIGFGVYDLTTGRKEPVAKASAEPVPAGAATTDKPGALWGKSCEPAPDGKQTCAIIQNIVITDKNTNQSLRALAVAVGYMPGGGDKLRMALTVPLGINLPAGVGFQIDDGQSNTLPIETCIADGCHIIMSIDAGGRDSLVKSKLIKITYQLVNGQKMALPIELTGFGDALAQLAPNP